MDPKKINVRFLVYKGHAILVGSCIRSFGLLDEWARHSCKMHYVLLRPRQISLVPFCSLIPTQN